MKKHGDGADGEGGDLLRVLTLQKPTRARAPESNLHTALIGVLMRLLFP